VQIVETGNISFKPQPKAQALRKCMRCFMRAYAFGCGLNDFGCDRARRGRVVVYWK
jgi:hypothetical protein